MGFGDTGSSSFSASVGPFTGHAFDINLTSTGVGVFNEIKIVDDGIPADPSNSVFNGADIDAVECLNNLAFGPDHIEKRNTGLTDIDVGFGVEQAGFEFIITIWNNTGDDLGLDGLIFRDVVPGEFDLSGDPDSSDDIACVVTTDNPEGAKKKNLSKLEPEFIDIDASLLMNGESCTITVFVETDAKTFPRGKSPAYAPTSCDTTIVLNEGVQVFLDDGDDEGEVDKNDTPLFLDDDSIELTCLFL